MECIFKDDSDLCLITVHIEWPQCFFHGDLDRKNYFNIVFMTYLGDKTENMKKKVVIA